MASNRNLRVARSVAIAGLLTMSACQHPYAYADISNGGPRISDKAWLSGSSTVNSDVENADFVPSECPGGIGSNKNENDIENNPDHIAKCIDAMVLLIDIRWYHFAASLNAFTNGANFVLDLAQLGLGGAGSLAGKGAAQILSAINGGLGGTKTALDSDVFLKNSITIIIHQMISDRAKDYTNILNREAAGKAMKACPNQAVPSKDDADRSPTTPTSTAPYCTIEEAEVDLYQYAVDGTWMSALANLQTSTAATAQACTNQLKQTSPDNS